MRHVLALTALLAGTTALGQDGTPTESTIRKFVEDLGSEEYGVREAAQKELEKIGKAALPLLKEAYEKAEDVERRARLEEIIRAIEPPPEPEKKAENDDGTVEREFRSGNGVMRMRIARSRSGEHPPNENRDPAGRFDAQKTFERLEVVLKEIETVAADPKLTEDERCARMLRLAADLQRAANEHRVAVRMSGFERPRPEEQEKEKNIPTEDKPKPEPREY